MLLLLHFSLKPMFGVERVIRRTERKKKAKKTFNINHWDVCKWRCAPQFIFLFGSFWAFIARWVKVKNPNETSNRTDTQNRVKESKTDKRAKEITAKKNVQTPIAQCFLFTSSSSLSKFELDPHWTVSCVLRKAYEAECEWQTTPKIEPK